MAANSAAAAGTVVAEAPAGTHFDLGGLEGKALRNAELPLSAYPKKSEVYAAIPDECFEKDTLRSLAFAATSTAITLACFAVGACGLIPLTWAAAPAWLLYGFVTGTAATGCWVVAHECGHGAFSDNRKLQDAVGYMLHSALLVPYFSWQRSHAVHHARTNHLTEGETHVPAVAGTAKGDLGFNVKESIGEGPWALFNSIIVFLFGWPAYLLAGASGGPVRGQTNHFVPTMGEQGRHCLFPGAYKRKVWFSDVGVVATLAALAAWGAQVGAAKVLCAYGLPYLFTNFWLVLYTWLQHTDVDVPHYDDEDWNWVKGAFLTIDRPYWGILDFLHHRIGSTHVAHHVNHTIPHYHAEKATKALKEAFPHLYLYDPTPVHKATWRVLTKCLAVTETAHGAFVSPPPGRN
eukprot:PRCOL_00003680-RA